MFLSTKLICYSKIELLRIIIANSKWAKSWALEHFRVLQLLLENLDKNSTAFCETGHLLLLIFALVLYNCYCFGNTQAYISYYFECSL